MKMNIKKLGKFTSRRNVVHLAITDDGYKVIFKRYKDKKGMEIDYTILSKFAHCGYAPKVLERGDDYLINEYIEGEMFYDKFRLATMMDDVKEQTNLATELSIFLQIFYSIFDGYIIGEINFKNFILRDNRCYGIDYEKAREGMQYQDVADIVANALYHTTGDPSASLPFITAILKNFHLEVIDIVNDVKIALERITGGMSARVDVSYFLNVLMFYNDQLQKRYIMEGLT